jgi:hypothetical protein
MDFDLQRKGIGTWVEEEEGEEHHTIQAQDFLVAEEIMLEEDQVEVEEGYHSFEGTVVEAGEEVELVHFDPEKTMAGEAVLVEEKVRDVTMKQRLMKGVVEVEVHY